MSKFWDRLSDYTSGNMSQFKQVNYQWRTQVWSETLFPKSTFWRLVFSHSWIRMHLQLDCRDELWNTYVKPFSKMFGGLFITYTVPGGKTVTNHGIWLEWRWVPDAHHHDVGDFSHMPRPRYNCRPSNRLGCPSPGICLGHRSLPNKRTSNTSHLLSPWPFTADCSLFQGIQWWIPITFLTHFAI